MRRSIPLTNQCGPVAGTARESPHAPLLYIRPHRGCSQRPDCLSRGFVTRNTPLPTADSTACPLTTAASPSPEKPPSGPSTRPARFVRHATELSDARRPNCPTPDDRAVRRPTAARGRCPTTAVRRPLSDYRCPTTAVRRPLSGDRCPTTATPDARRSLSEEHYPTTTVRQALPNARRLSLRGPNSRPLMPAAHRPTSKDRCRLNARRRTPDARPSVHSKRGIRTARLAEDLKDAKWWNRIRCKNVSIA